MNMYIMYVYVIMVMRLVFLNWVLSIENESFLKDDWDEFESQEL